MNSRRKGKKNNKSRSKNEEVAEKATVKFSPYAFFNAGEISQIKSALKIKEVLSIPIVIGCVILNRIDILEKAIKSGVDVNEVGPSNTTALTWAVRQKYLNIIKILLDNEADPTIKVDNGENIIIIALEHKLWDEMSFITFWDMVIKVTPIDVNLMNKNGHTLLHIAVRKEWEKFIEKLLAEKVNIDITNINGVTPLMTACFRNNLNIVNLLINNGANFTKEDNHYRTALCYAIIHGAKVAKPPFMIAERIIYELKKDLSYKEYIKRRIEIIDLILEKDRISEQEAQMLIILINYIVQYTENGLKILLEFKIFELIQKKIQNETKQKLLLQITQELLCYNEQVNGFNSEIQMNLSKQFVASNIIVTCLSIVQRRTAYFNLALYVIIAFCTLNETGFTWMKENYDQGKLIFKDLPCDYNNYIQKDFPDEKRQRLMKKKMKKLRRNINTIESGTSSYPKPVEAKQIYEKKSDPFFNIKKSKRRTKLIKAKITKIKTMELAERLSLTNNLDFVNKLKDNVKILEGNQAFAPETNSLTNKIKLFNAKKEENNDDSKQDNNRQSEERLEEQVKQEGDNMPLSLFDIQMAKDTEENEQLIKMLITDDLYCPCYFSPDNDEAKNPISNSLKDFLKQQEESQVKEEPCYIPVFPEWKSKIHRLPFNDWSMFGEKMKVDKKKVKAAIHYLKNISSNLDNTANAVILDSALNVVIDYLKELLDIIVTRSKAGWDISQDNTQNNKNGKKSTYSEKQAISDLQMNFNNLISSICSLAHSSLTEAIKNIYHLESTLLRFPIRGKTLLSDVCALENVKIQYKTFSYQHETSLLTYMENVLNDFADAREDIKINVIEGLPNVMENAPSDLYAIEMKCLSSPIPRNKRKELEAKIKTMENAYHLTQSIEKLLDDNEELPPKINSLQKLETSDNNIESTAGYSEIVLKILTKHVDKEDGKKKENEKSRWAEKIRHLQSMKHNSQLLLGGSVRLCRYPERNHVISQGGNFNLVTLGLNSNDQPLAVKKIPSDHCICQSLKSLINPLLGLRNRHILHYFLCDYEGSDLIIATPLCEYNIGQYVLLLKENGEKNIFNLNQMEIVRQFLSGLAFLHQQKEPIVHGNLKPSNIFVDINGVVRLAEFGISNVLFKLIEAPKSSLIWFSQETYKLYRITSNLECSLPSDIQVAGMLVYFIASAGVHPFGPDVDTILKNLEKSSFILPPTRETKNQIFADLVSWMLMCEPNDRPHIKEIMSHVHFWTSDRRWRFILNCSGISTNGVPLGIDTELMHEKIDETATKEQIKGHWVTIAKKKFPTIQVDGQDTVVGFLKFIKDFYEAQIMGEERSIEELKACVLTYFPAFPLTLYRIMEATGLIKEYPFITYTTSEIRLEYMDQL